MGGGADSEGGIDGGVGEGRIDAGLKQAFKNNSLVRAQLPALTSAVQSGQMAASTAARNLLALHASGAAPSTR